MQPEYLLDKINPLDNTQIATAMADMQQTCALQGSPSDDGMVFGQLCNALPDITPSTEPEPTQNYAKFDMPNGMEL